MTRGQEKRRASNDQPEDDEVQDGQKIDGRVEQKPEAGEKARNGGEPRRKVVTAPGDDRGELERAGKRQQQPDHHMRWQGFLHRQQRRSGRQRKDQQSSHADNGGAGAIGHALPS